MYICTYWFIYLTKHILLVCIDERSTTTMCHRRRGGPERNETPPPGTTSTVHEHAHQEDARTDTLTVVSAMSGGCTASTRDDEEDCESGCASYTSDNDRVHTDNEATPPQQLDSAETAADDNKHTQMPHRSRRQKRRRTRAAIQSTTLSASESHSSLSVSSSSGHAARRSEYGSSVSHASERVIPGSETEHSDDVLHEEHRNRVHSDPCDGSIRHRTTLDYCIGSDNNNNNSSSSSKSSQLGRGQPSSSSSTSSSSLSLASMASSVPKAYTAVPGSTDTLHRTLLTHSTSMDVHGGHDTPAHSAALPSVCTPTRAEFSDAETSHDVPYTSTKLCATSHERCALEQCNENEEEAGDVVGRAAKDDRMTSEEMAPAVSVRSTCSSDNDEEEEGQTRCADVPDCAAETPVDARLCDGGAHHEETASSTRAQSHAANEDDDNANKVPPPQQKKQQQPEEAADEPEDDSTNRRRAPLLKTPLPSTMGQGVKQHAATHTPAAITKRRTRRRPLLMEDHPVFAEHRDLRGSSSSSLASGAASTGGMPARQTRSGADEESSRLVSSSYAHVSRDTASAGNRKHVFVQAPYASEQDVLRSLNDWSDAREVVYAELLWTYAREEMLELMLQSAAPSLDKPSSSAQGGEEKEDEQHTGVTGGTHRVHQGDASAMATGSACVRKRSRALSRQGSTSCTRIKRESAD